MAILGIDEVGRGPLAGPLVVGAVILPEFEIGASGELISGPEWILELKDSKKLSAKKREYLSERILAEAPATGLGWVSADELDLVGISEALRLATRRAVKSVQRLHAGISRIVIDGKVNFLSLTNLEKYVTTMPKADNLVKEVSAASIIAKVARDRYMRDLSLKCPGYGFEKNVGYGTKAHLEAIHKIGICPEHRKSFEPIKSMVGFKRPDDVSVVKNTTLVGERGEDAVCEFLKEKGYEIVARNFKTKICEIDIVSMKDEKIYFTEVKMRKNADFGGGMVAVDKKKLEKMKLGVEVFLKMKPQYQRFSPLLAVASVNGEYEVEEWVVLD